MTTIQSDLLLSCCEICEGLKGKHFPVIKMMPGENAPPMHPHCRCSTAAWADDAEYEAWLDYLDNGGTTAEWNETGKAEWKKAENSKKDLKIGEKGTIIKSFNIGRSIGAQAKNYPVRMPNSKQHVKLAEGQTITGKVFAGMGTSEEIRDRFDLEAIYKVPASKIQKVSGEGFVIVKGKKLKAELHWYEAEGERFDMKIKRFLK